MHTLFKALGDPHRLEIVRLLRRGPLHVQAVADRLGITQPAVSRHVRQLARAGLIQLEREGRRTLLRCPPRQSAPVVRALLALLPAEGSGPPASPPAANAVDSGDLEDYLL